MATHPATAREPGRQNPAYKPAHRHPPPDFHAHYGEDDAAFDIDGNLLEGSLERRQRRAVTSWANAHRGELLMCWEHASQKKDPGTIEPTT